MNNKTHIDMIIAESSFENRSKLYPEKCPCYTSKPCHDIKDLNCFLCYCPEYDNSKEIGGCKINNPCGKWYYNNLLPEEKIWDCSDCTYPHSKEVVKKYLTKLFNVKE